MAGAYISFVYSPWPPCEIMMMSSDESAPEYPGAHGTGFFVTFRGALYLLTARHCMGKIGDDLAARAACLMIPASPVLEGQKVTVADYVRFSTIGRAVVNERLDEFASGLRNNPEFVELSTKPDRIRFIRRWLDSEIGFAGAVERRLKN